MFERHYQCGNSFSRLFLQAEGKAGGGSETLPIKQQLENANARVAELEPKAKEADDLKTKLSDAEGKVTALEGEKAQLTQNLADANTKVTGLETKVTALDGDLKAANQKATDATAAKDKAEADLKTTDERTETRLREISARNGGTLPPKAAGAGDHTQEETKADATPREKLAGIFKVA